jgi:hypothetical protein
VTRRELDISRAAHSIAYMQGSMNFRREHFASHPQAFRQAPTCCIGFAVSIVGECHGSYSISNSREARTAHRPDYALCMAR